MLASCNLTDIMLLCYFKALYLRVCRFSVVLTSVKCMHSHSDVTALTSNTYHDHHPALIPTYTNYTVITAGSHGKAFPKSPQCLGSQPAAEPPELCLSLWPSVEIKSRLEISRVMLLFGVDREIEKSILREPCARITYRLPREAKSF